jgi:tRNA-2-methylthio-N6-dimethylallyladenosine synthase
MDGQVAPKSWTSGCSGLQAALNRAAASPSTGARSASAASVLVERKGKLEGQWLGKSPWLQSVHILATEGSDRRYCRC